MTGAGTQSARDRAASLARSCDSGFVKIDVADLRAVLASEGSEPVGPWTARLMEEMARAVLADGDDEPSFLGHLVTPHGPDGDVLFVPAGDPLPLAGKGRVQPVYDGPQNVSSAHPPPALREDYRLVPIEPTREMWAASAEAINQFGHKLKRHHDRYSDAVWRAMLAASPNIAVEQPFYDPSSNTLERMHARVARSAAEWNRKVAPEREVGEG